MPRLRPSGSLCLHGMCGPDQQESSPTLILHPDGLTTLAPAQVTAKRLRKARIISDVVDGVSLDKTLLESFVIDYGSSSVDCGGLFPKSQASTAQVAFGAVTSVELTRSRTALKA